MDSMIKVTFGYTNNTQSKIIPASTTLRELLTTEGIDYSRGQTTLDGSMIQAGGMDRSFADYGITGAAYLLVTNKTENA